MTISILLMTFLFQTFSKIGMLVDYKLNRIEYLKSCQNIDKPLLHCNGQCVLMKKLKKQAEKEAKQATVNLEQLASIHHLDTFTFPKNNRIARRITKHYPQDMSYTFLFAETIFHPPLFSI